MPAQHPMDLAGCLPEEIAALVAPLGEPSYRGSQLFSWIWARDASRFEEMSNIPARLRAWLEEGRTFTRLLPEEVLHSSDGSSKLLFRLAGGARVTSVLMPASDRATVCISSQAGCRMGCRFCLTGRSGFTRDLRAAEIAAQVAAAARLARPVPVRNVVLMGMGEPLDNLDEMVRAVRIITRPAGLAIATRRVTVSTVGLADRMARFIESETGASLALSLCATTDESRREIVPVAGVNPLEKIANVLASHPPRPGHRYTIEYLMLAGYGDSTDDARRLSRMLARFPAKVNLIPFNPWPGAPFERPTPETVERFKEILEGKHHVVTIRSSRGQDIGAACGQLS